MGNSQSSSAAQLASSGLPVLESINPCHLSGDPDLYGIGIRVGFYLQYAAAAIAVVAGIDREFVGWRAAFVPLAAATFIGLCINSTGHTLVIIDWAIMIQLVLWFPIFFAYPVVAKGFWHDFDARDQLRQAHIYMKSVESDRVAGFDDYRRSLAIFSGALVRAADLILQVTARSPLEVQDLIRNFQEVAHNWDGANQQRPPGDATDDGGDSEEARSLLEPIITDITTRNSDAALALTELQREIIFRIVPKVNRAYGRILAVAEEDRATKDYIKWLGFALKRMHDLGLVDKISAGTSLITYSGYCFFTPWLFFIGIDRGAKAGCDVKVLFLVVPISVYNHGFVIVLRISAVIAVVVGVICFIIGAMFVFIGILELFEEAQKKRQLDGQHPPNQPVQPNLHTRRALLHVGQTRRGNEENHGITAELNLVGKLYHEYVNEDRKFSKEEVDKYITFNRLGWGSGLLFLLFYTIALVETTIKVNHLTSGILLKSTGQLIALIVGIFMITVVVVKCLIEFSGSLGLNFQFTTAESVKRFLYRILGILPGNQDPEREAVLVPANQAHGLVRGRVPEMIQDREIREVDE